MNDQPINGHDEQQPVRLTKAMLAAHARIKAALPAQEFESQMLSFAGEIAGLAQNRNITPRKAAVLLAKFAVNNGDRIVADKVFAALVWWAQPEPTTETIQ